MKKKIIFIFLILFILGAVIFFYINEFFLKGKIKDVIEQKIAEAISRRITIEEIGFRLPAELTATNIRIYQKESVDDLFASMDNLSVNIILPAILFNKKIIISSIKAIHPTVYLIKESAQDWNFSDLLQLTNKENPPKQDAPLNILVRKISLKNGFIHIQDKSRETPWESSFENINLEAGLSLTGQLNYNLSVTIPKTKGDLQSKGSYSIATNNFSSQSSSHNIYLNDYLPLITLPVPVKLKSAIFHSEGIQVSYKNNAMEANGEIILDQLDARLNNEQDIRGNIAINALSLKMEKEKIQAKGIIKINAARIFLNQETGLEGDLSADIEGLQYAPNNISFKGNLSFKNTASSRLPYIQINKNQILKASLEGLNIDIHLKNNDLSGKADILMKPFSLQLNPDTHLQGEFSAKINSVKTTDLYKNIFIEGDLFLDNALAEIAETQKLEGSFKASSLRLMVKDKDIELSSNLTAQNLNAQITKDQLLKCDLSTQNTKASVKGDDIALQTSLDIKNIFFSFGKDQTFQGNISSPQTIISLNKGSLTAKTTLNITNGVGIIGPQKFEGNPNLTLVYKSDPAKTTPQYSGTLSLNAVRASGLPTIGAISDLTAMISFDQDHLETQKLTLKTNNISIESSGIVRNFLNPFLDIKIKTGDIIIEDIAKLFPDVLKNAGVTIKGLLTLTANYKGLLQKPLDADAQVISQLKNVFVSSDKLPSPIANLSGEINYQKNLLTLKNVGGFFQDKRYNITAEVKNFSQPAVKIDILSDDIKATAQITVAGQNIQIATLKANYLNSSCDLKGDIFLKNNAEPTIDMRGILNVNIADLRNFLPANIKEQLYQLKPLGTLSIDGTLKGAPTNWTNWHLSFKATSARFSVMNYAIENIKIDFTQKNQAIDTATLNATIYGGNFNMALVSDLSQNTLPIKTSMTLENLDLTLLQKDAKTPIKNLAGLMSAALQVSGPILDQNKIKGAANLSIVDGNLGQIIPEFRNTIFNAASADFTIQDGKFKTENATIKSNMLDLKAKGWNDFAKNINFDIAPSSNQPAGDESGRMKLSLPALLEKGFVIKITGSIDNIKYKLEPIPMKILENTTGTVTDVIKTGINILEGLF